jgi:putative hemolysin
MHQWKTAIILEVGRTVDYEFEIYKSDNTAQEISATDVVRFKLFTTNGTIALDLDSVDSDVDSRVTINDLGDEAAGEPAIATVRFGQSDTAILSLGEYNGEILHVDDSEANPADALKRIAHGRVRVVAAGGGDTGLA